MEESPLDQRLLDLVLAAQNSPPNSRERRKILGQLFSTLRNSKQLVCPMQGQFQGFYNDIYEEALQRLFFYICRKVDNYNPARGSVLAWVNFLLKRRFFIEASREFMATVYRGMDARDVKIVNVDDLAQVLSSDIVPNSEGSLLKELKGYLQDDPDNSFQMAHVEGYPKVSFQWIATQRFDGYSWREIADTTGITTTTLSSFYQRSIKKFAPKIRQDLL